MARHYSPYFEDPFLFKSHITSSPFRALVKILLLNASPPRSRELPKVPTAKPLMRAVATYLDRKIPHEMNVPPAGWEVWLRNESVRHGELVPVRCWVNHDARTLSYSPPTEDGASVNGDRAYS